ncbi:MAG: S41 family peptidase, partial [Myxococcota bacterium]
ALFDGKDKLPFYFCWVGQGRMVVTERSAQLPQGSEIVRINDVSVDEIVETLLPYVKGDGDRRDIRLHALAVDGLQKRSAFDIYFPLLFGPTPEGTYKLEFIPPSGQTTTKVVRAVHASEREATLRGAQRDEVPWAYERLAPSVGLVRLRTFAMFNNDFDWAGFIDALPRQLKSDEVEHLIIDLRGNEGGEDRVAAAFMSLFARNEMRAPPVTEEVVAHRVSKELRAFVKTWDPSFYDMSAKLMPTATPGRYKMRKSSGVHRRIARNPSAYAGRLYFLIDRAASSATFTLAEMVKRSALGTLIGEETGGSGRGTSGGAILFLHLPYSGLEGDIPLIAFQPAHPRDGGIRPDIRVDVSVEDIAQDRDPFVVAALHAIERIEPGERP